MNTTGIPMPEIAVLRGGVTCTEESLRDGAEVLRSLTSLGYVPLDIVIGRDGEWVHKGLPTDAHYIFTRAHYVVDTTRDKKASYKLLAKRMGVELILSHDHVAEMDRETMYRLLRQQGIATPQTQIIRTSSSLTPQALKRTWQVFHTPLIVRPLSRDYGSSKLIRHFHDLDTTLHDFQSRGIETHLFTYSPKNTVSLAVLPSFRGSDVYTPLPIETFVDKNSLPQSIHPIRATFQMGEERKEHLRRVVTDAYRALDLHGHALVDLIPYKDTYMVVNIDTEPSLRKDGRFMQSLATTGVDIGQYIHMHITHDRNR